MVKIPPTSELEHQLIKAAEQAPLVHAELASTADDKLVRPVMVLNELICIHPVVNNETIWTATATKSGCAIRPVPSPYDAAFLAGFLAALLPDGALGLPIDEFTKLMKTMPAESKSRLRKLIDEFAAAILLEDDDDDEC